MGPNILVPFLFLIKGKAVNQPRELEVLIPFLEMISQRKEMIFDEKNKHLKIKLKSGPGPQTLRCPREAPPAKVRCELRPLPWTTCTDQLQSHCSGPGKKQPRQGNRKTGNSSAEHLTAKVHKPRVSGHTGETCVSSRIPGRLQGP